MEAPEATEAKACKEANSVSRVSILEASKEYTVLYSVEASEAKPLSLQFVGSTVTVTGSDSYTVPEKVIGLITVQASRSNDTVFSKLTVSILDAWTTAIKNRLVHHQ